MSNQARNKDIAALLARGVIRVKKQPLVAKAIESQMPAKHDVSNISENSVNHDSQVSQDQSRDGGDECQLNMDDFRMAKELGMSPKSLMKNVPNPGQQRKTPVKIWIRDLYEKRQRQSLKNLLRDSIPCPHALHRRSN